MSRVMLEKQIRSLPEEYLDEVSHYIEYVLFRIRTKDKTDQKHDLRSYFGVLKNLPDGMSFQKEVRNEWD